MKLGEVVKRVIINHRKLTDYALDPDNPTGRHKALIFERRLGLPRTIVAPSYNRSRRSHWTEKRFYSVLTNMDAIIA